MKKITYYQVYCRIHPNIIIDKPTKVLFEDESDAFIYTLKKNREKKTPFYFYKKVTKKLFTSLDDYRKNEPLDKSMSK